jgi:glycosyltransferase involved in cell wall biosynthesis
MALLSQRGVLAELSIVGEGSQREALTGLAAELNISERVHFTGWLDTGGLRRVFAESDVFCLLPDTSYHDGLPNVVLEAQALGRPVVISNLPAAAEAVTHGVDGFIVEPDDIEGTCDVLARLAGNARLRRDISAAARARVQRQHDASQHLERLRQLLLSDRDRDLSAEAPCAAAACP